MNEPVPLKAERPLGYHDRRCAETFEETSRLDAHFDKSEISPGLNRRDSTEAHRFATMHFDCALVAEILTDLANTMASLHREALREARLIPVYRVRKNFRPTWRFGCSISWIRASVINATAPALQGQFPSPHCSRGNYLQVAHRHEVAWELGLGIVLGTIGERSIRSTHRKESLTTAESFTCQYLRHLLRGSCRRSR